MVFDPVRGYAANDCHRPADSRGMVGKEQEQATGITYFGYSGGYLSANGRNDA